MYLLCGENSLAELQQKMTPYQKCKNTHTHLKLTKCYIYSTTCNFHTFISLTKIPGIFVKYPKMRPKIAVFYQVVKKPPKRFQKGILQKPLLFFSDARRHTTDTTDTGHCTFHRIDVQKFMSHGTWDCLFFASE